MIVDCSDYGPVGPWVGTVEEVASILEFAQHMIDVHDENWLLRWVDDWCMALAWESVMEDPVGDAWYGRCLLLQAVQGLQGTRTPRVQVISG